MAETEEIYKSYLTYEDGKQSNFIELRDEQKAAVKAAKDYFEKSVDNQRFLWNCKMRFGKTFCAMELAIEMGESEIDPKGKKDSKPISRVLILTHRPVVQDGFAKDLGKLQDSLKANGQLNREWEFGTRSENDNFGNFYDLQNGAKSQNKPYVFFSSTQWLCLSKEVGGAIDDPLRKSILNTDWDLVVIDEAHEGILADRGSVVIDKLTKERTKMLYMSGTPFNLLEGINGFTKDQIYSWDYIEEQKKKNNWGKDPKKRPNEVGKTNPYQELPKMNIFAFDMGTLIPGKDYKKGDMFSFGEMFRTFVGRPEVDIVDGKPYKASKEEIGKFVHEKDVQKFLDLMYKGDEKTNYPYTKEQYQENFRHTLWIVPGVKEAKALEDLLEKHELFGSDDFKVVNVAGNNEVDENLNDLGRVKEAIANYPYTITLSCGKLTTGVTVPEWTAVFYMKGSADSSPATYMQTIFRVQSPHVYEDNGEKRMKANCYVFDFAPGRSLKVVAATAKFARKTKTAKNKANIITQNDEDIIKDFTTYCPIWQPVVAKAGSSLQPISTDKIITELNKVYVENIVKNGFDDYNIYLDDEIRNLTDEVITETEKIVANIPGDNTGQKKKEGTELSNDGGLTTTTTKKRTPKQKQTEKEKWQKEVEAGKTTEDFDTWLARKDMEAAQDEKLKNTRKLIHAITKRIPLLMFGAEVDDEKIGINIDNVTERIDDDSWNEFMPKGATKSYFKKIKHCYNDSMFRKAGTMIRQMAIQADDMHIEDRIAKIAQIFAYFKNPDKETVLTPWPVVNMHMSDTLGGYCFFDETFKKPNMIPALNPDGTEVLDEDGKVKMVETRFPRFVGADRQVTKDIFCNLDKDGGECKTKVLEINSKTGLYPLYVTYSLYRPLLEHYKKEHAIDDPDNLAVSEEQAIWDTIIKKNIYVICNTDMAARITYRTLAGHRPIKGVDTSTISKEHYVKGMHIVSDKLVEKAISDRKSLINEIKNAKYWHNNGENMHFDAVVGNPPYQMTVAKKETDNGQKRVSSIFHHFQLLSDEIASYSSLIYPGGRWIHRSAKGLAQFGLDQINDKHLKLMYFFPDANEIFAEAGISDGISIVLKDYHKQDLGFDYVYSVRGLYHKVQMQNPGEELMTLNPFDKEVVDSINATVKKNNFDYLHDSVLSQKLFSIESDFVEKNPSKVRLYNEGDSFDQSMEIKLFANDKGGKAGRGRWYVANRNIITTGTQYLDDWKVIVSSANAGGQKRSNQLAIVDNYSAFGRSRVALKTFKTKKEAENFYKYCKSELIRFAFLMTDEALTSLAKQVPDIKNYNDDNGFINFDEDINEQLYTLFGINDVNTRKYIHDVLSTKADAEKVTSSQVEETSES